jgi:hypothetical protein
VANLLVMALDRIEQDEQERSQQRRFVVIR